MSDQKESVEVMQMAGQALAMNVLSVADVHGAGAGVSLASKPEEEDVVQLAGRLFRTYMSAFESHVGVPMPRWRIMEALHEHGDAFPPAQKKLVEKLGMDPGALTRQVQNLEEKGWISRKVDERDQRLTNVAMTDVGSHALEKATPARDDFLAKVMDGVPQAELKAVVDTLSRLDSRLKEMMLRLTKPRKAD